MASLPNFEFWYSGELNPMEQGRQKVWYENTIILMAIISYKIGIEQWIISYWSSFEFYNSELVTS